MIVLDTNIVSELEKPRPDIFVHHWFASTGVDNTYLCGPVMMEKAYGAEKYRLKSGSERYAVSLAKLRGEYVGRILPLDGAASELAGRLRAVRESKGRPLSIGNVMIAAICLIHGAMLATRNVRDFDGLDLKLINPFEKAA